MGTEAPNPTPFQWAQLYTQPIEELPSLCAEVTDEEIREVIKRWPSGKSPGPDGFPGEFYKFFLEELIPDIRATLNHAFSQNSMQPLNTSHIVLVPKKDSPLLPSDFRPISVVHSMQRIASKILANRIVPLLQDRIHISQAGFLRGRIITENFLVAQHTVQKASSQGTPLAVFKADIHKAFDALSWAGLSSILRAMGFPCRMIEIICGCVLQGLSRVVLNGIAGRKLNLKRGVRQGDPLSPYLFIIAMDFLAKWVHSLSLQGLITTPPCVTQTCLLYADDTIFFLEPTISECNKLKLILSTFQQLTGLALNSAKSDLITIATPQHV